MSSARVCYPAVTSDDRGAHEVPVLQLFLALWYMVLDKVHAMRRVPIGTCKPCATWRTCKPCANWHMQALCQLAQHPGDPPGAICRKGTHPPGLLIGEAPTFSAGGIR
jgi:hypothetical protein